VACGFAVNAEGEVEVLDVLVQSTRDKRTALTLMRELLKKYPFAPERFVIDDLRYKALRIAISASGTCIARRIRISRADERSARRNTSRVTIQLCNSSQRAPPSNAFNLQRHLTSPQTHRTLRAAAMSKRGDAGAAA